MARYTALHKNHHADVSAVSHATLSVPFIPQHQLEELCSFAFIADKEARSDLAGGYVRDEDDYTSNFTGAFRRIVNSNSCTGLRATSYMLSPRLERRTGCDATIVLTNRSSSKIATFEAKLPRLASRTSGWDYPQTATGLSHFSDQLDRQLLVHPSVAVFEMFYAEFPFGRQPSWMQPEVSSCVWRDEAVAFDKSRATRNPWTDLELESMLRSAQRDIRAIFRDLAACSVGVLVPIIGTGGQIAEELGLEGLVLQITAGG